MGTGAHPAIAFVKADHQPPEDHMPYIKLCILAMTSDKTFTLMLGDSFNIRDEVRNQGSDVSAFQT